jgi:hypothetical protein
MYLKNIKEDVYMLRAANVSDLDFIFQLIYEGAKEGYFNTQLYENRLPVSPSNRKRQECCAAKQQRHAVNAVSV